MSGHLHRLTLTFKPEGVEIRALYRSERGPNPGTKARAKEVVDLTRSGLQDALKVLEGRTEVIGTSGYEVREDTIGVDAARKKGA